MDRNSIISKVFNLVASSRPETAIRLNENIAPIIQTVAFIGSDFIFMIQSSKFSITCGHVLAHARRKAFRIKK
jgi:hypothetical protein